MSESSVDPSSHRLIGRIGEYAVGVGVALYTLGYLVVTIYLGSLNILVTDIVRTRYIVVGLLFAGFLACALVPLWALWRLLVTRDFDRHDQLIRAAIWSAFKHYLFIGIVIASIAGLTRQTSSLDFLLDSHPDAPILEWLHQLPETAYDELVATTIDYARIVGVLGGLILVLAILFAAVASILPKKYREKLTPNRRVRNQAAENSEKQSVRAIIVEMVLSLAALVVCFAAIRIGYKLIGLLLVPTSGSTGWGRFYFGSLACFMVAAFGLLQAQVRPKRDVAPDEYEAQARRFYWFWGTLGMAYLISVVLPAYALAIYPHIPQQVGGGRLVRVSLAGVPEVRPGDKSYILDRGSERLTLLVESASGIRRILELDQGRVERLEFRYEAPKAAVPRKAESKPAPARSNEAPKAEPSPAKPR